MSGAVQGRLYLLHLQERSCKLRKAAVRFVVSVCLSIVLIYQPGSSLDRLLLNSMFGAGVDGAFTTICRENPNSVKIGRIYEALCVKT